MNSKLTNDEILLENGIAEQQRNIDYIVAVAEDGGLSDVDLSRVIYINIYEVRSPAAVAATLAMMLIREQRITKALRQEKQSTQFAE